jgi:hypothetical protein
MTNSAQEAEWKLLQLLCNEDLDPALRSALCTQLSAERFSDTNHRVIFEEIRAVSPATRPVTAAQLRECLPARVTARGFPEAEFGDLLFSERSKEDISVTIRGVLATLYR